jgi:hypothetical protein
LTITKSKVNLGKSFDYEKGGLMKNFVKVILVLPALIFANIEFNNPVMCSNLISDWWSIGHGCIGDNNELYEAWTHTGLGSGEGGIYFAASYDTNQTWSSDITIHYWDPTWVHAEYTRPRLASTRDTVYCIYWLRPEHANTTYHLYCSRSDNRGASWNIFDISITGDYSGSMYGHDIAIGPDQTINLAFATAGTWLSRSRPFFCRSDNNGVTFSQPILLPCDTTIVIASYPSVSVTSDNRIFVVTTYYTSAGGSQLYLAVSNDSGRTFDTTNLTSAVGNGSYPELKVGINNNLYLCFETPDDEVKCTFSTDGGITWQTPTLLVSNNFGWAFEAEDSRLVVVWNDDASWDAYFRISDDGGLTWSEPSRVWSSSPFPGDWLQLNLDVHNDLATISMHPEPGNVEAQYCSHATWPLEVTEPIKQPVVINPKLIAKPNPFSNFTRISCSEKMKQPVTLAIFNSTGRLVQKIEFNSSINWNGCDQKGNRLPSGVYLVRCEGFEPVRLVLSE